MRRMLYYTGWHGLEFLSMVRACFGFDQGTRIDIDVSE
jgi:hypothetical protein